MRITPLRSLPLIKRCALLGLVLLLADCTSSPNLPDYSQWQGKQTPAERRIAAWRWLITTQFSLPDAEKLTLVNRFINRLVFVSDREHWGQEDYWATPYETVYSGGGDCEDFAIAKYFTLKYLQIPDRKMRLVFVRALSLRQSHMVLVYFATPQSEPLVLDNLDPTIKPLSQRTDLRPFYSFNAKGFWAIRKKDAMEYLGKASRIGVWQDLMEKMARNQESL